MPQCARDAVECARRYSGCEVIPLTNHPEPGWIDVGPYTTSANRVRQFWSESSRIKAWAEKTLKPTWLESRAMLRWFVIREYIEKHSIRTPIVNCDWDMLFFHPIEPHLDRFEFRRYDIADCKAREIDGPGDCSSPYVVNNLCSIAFLTDTFEALIKHDCPILINGSGSDMGWWWQIKRMGGYSSVNLSEERDGCLFDLNIILDLDIYQDNGAGSKQIVMVDGKPHFIRRDNQNKVKAICVHCFMGWKELTGTLMV